MSNKLTIVFSGRKQAGKSTMCNYILAKYLNKVSANNYHYYINSIGNLLQGGSFLEPLPSKESNPCVDDSLIEDYNGFSPFRQDFF